jgi:very-short-patch-repair endonuclease
MIDNIKNKEIFGYDYNDLLNNSTKLVHIKCDFCLSEFTRRRYQMNKGNRSSFPHACINCDQIKSNWIKNNPDRLSPIEFHDGYPKIDLLKINIEKTKIKFGYDPSCLSYKSEKIVVATCEFCDKEFDTKVSNLMKNDGVCCNKCSSINSYYVRSSSVLSKKEFRDKNIGIQYLSVIDVDKTVREFGYDPIGLSPKCERPIFVFCSFCNKSFKISKMSYLQKSHGQVSCTKCRYKLIEKTLNERYGVRNTLLIPEVINKLKNPSTELLISSVLNDFNIKYERNYSIGPYSFDFYVDSYDLLIECHGDYFHNFKNNGYEGTSKDKAKTTYIEKYTNKKLIWIWEHEIHSGRMMEILDRYLFTTPLKKIIVENEDKIVISQITKIEAYKFLSLYHYLGNLGTAAIPYGCYYENELIVVAVIGGITRESSIGKINKETNNKFKSGEVKELRRFCVRSNIELKNLASILVRILKLVDMKIKVISAFLDPNTKDMIDIYKITDWVELSESSKSYHYFDFSTTKLIHKKTIFEMAQSAHMNENEFVKKTGFLKISEVPKKAFVYIRN